MSGYGALPSAVNPLLNSALQQLLSMPFAISCTELINNKKFALQE